MPVYQWKGINAKGNKKKGKFEATDEKQLENLLKRFRITDYTYKEAPKDLLLFKPKVAPKDVMIFTRQFCTMIDSGLPLVQSLKVLADQEPNPTFKEALRDINSSVQSGSTLSDSMRKHVKIFDSLYCNLVAAGESAGILDSILKRLADYIEKAERLKRKVKGAMMYPAIVLSVALIVILVLLVVVIPIFEEVFAGMGAELPGLTQLVINASDMVLDNSVILLISLAVMVIIFLQIIKTAPGKRLLDITMLKTPVLGDLILKTAVAKFSRTLSTMLQAGVPIISSLDIVASTAGNVVVEEAITDSRIAIAEGRPLTDPFMESGLFPPMVVSMIAIGEEAGSLDGMLSKIADFYDEEVDTAVDSLTSMIEPLLIVFLGTTVGTLVIAMYLPIFNLGGGG